MKNSIVIFGMAHSGKTTCAGYIYSELKRSTEGFDFETYVNRMKKNLLAEYDSSRDYGYLLDKGNELPRTRYETEGTSKQLHLKNVSYSDLNFTIIDTPGAQHSEKQRQKGMFYGDVGIFFIEIHKILDEKFFFNREVYAPFMSTLILWSKYKRTTIIALTKMDLHQFDEKDFIKAKNIILQLCDILQISAVIPISINVKAREGHNIFDKSTHMQWYDGEVLMEAIIRELNKVKKEKEKSKLLFTVDRSYMQPVKKTGKCWRIKILSGNIEVGQKIILGPVKINKDYEIVTATIKNIRCDFSTDEGIKETTSASEGDIVGIDLGDIYAGHKKMSKREINTISTSVGLDVKQEYKITDTFSFYTSYKNMDKIVIKRQMDLLWYGRPITFEIIEKSTDDEGIRVKGKIMGRKMVIPLSESGECINSNIIIRYDKNGVDNPFMDAEMTVI